MSEATLLEFRGSWNVSTFCYGVMTFLTEWSRGRPCLHLDDYNSLVIHPMLIDLIPILIEHDCINITFFTIEKTRMSRCVSRLERMISPKGTFPILGKMIIFRFEVFHALSNDALFKILPHSLGPAQVRSRLTAVLTRLFRGNENFD
jgi:hypothetical protein